MFIDRLSRWFSARTLNNFGGIDGKISILENFPQQKVVPKPPEGGRGLRLCGTYHLKLPLYFDAPVSSLSYAHNIEFLNIIGSTIQTIVWTREPDLFDLWLHLSLRWPTGAHTDFKWGGGGGGVVRVKGVNHYYTPRLIYTGCSLKIVFFL